MFEILAEMGRVKFVKFGSRQRGAEPARDHAGLAAEDRGQMALVGEPGSWLSGQGALGFGHNRDAGGSVRAARARLNDSLDPDVVVGEHG